MRPPIPPDQLARNHTGPGRRRAPNPGAPLLHRLNRTEYAAVVEDLLGLKVDVTELLPPDDSAFGFDNNAEVLGLSPVLLERYLAAADRISELALGDDTEPASQSYRARQDLSQDQHIEGLPFGTDWTSFATLSITAQNSTGRTPGAKHRSTPLNPAASFFPSAETIRCATPCIGCIHRHRTPSDEITTASP